MEAANRLTNEARFEKGQAPRPCLSRAKRDGALAGQTACLASFILNHIALHQALFKYYFLFFFPYSA
jgi:hypothetical protein